MLYQLRPGFILYEDYINKIATRVKHNCFVGQSFQCSGVGSSNLGRASEQCATTMELVTLGAHGRGANPLKLYDLEISPS